MTYLENKSKRDTRTRTWHFHVIDGEESLLSFAFCKSNPLLVDVKVAGQIIT